MSTANSSGDVTLSNDQFRMAGTYSQAAFGGHDVGDHQVRVWNVNDECAVLTGTSASSNDDNATWSNLAGHVTIDVPKTFEIQHRCSAGREDIGFGRASIFSDTDNVYLQVTVTRHAQPADNGRAPKINRQASNRQADHGFHAVC